MWWTATFSAQWTASLMPPGATAWERAVDAVDGDLVARNPVELIPAARSDAAAPLALLPYLAAERSVDEYDGAWAEAQRRAVVAGSFEFHRRKGTRRALDLALTPLGLPVRTIEWFESSPRRRPYTFRVEIDVSQTGWTGPMRAQVQRAANSAKNAHTLLEELSLKALLAPGPVYVGAILTRYRQVDIGQVPRPIEITQASQVYVGAVQTIRRTVVIGPRP